MVTGTTTAINSIKDKKDRQMIILTQKRDKIVQVEAINLNGQKIVGYSTQHPMGVTLGKYNSKERAHSVFLSFFQYIKSSEKFNITYEMPEN